MAIPLRSESVPAPAALGDRDRLPSVVLYERDPGVAVRVHGFLSGTNISCAESSASTAVTTRRT